MPDYEAVIGLETHIQLNTTTKIFCACKADSWYDPPNTNMPWGKGETPIADILAAAMHSAIQPLSFFDRKNYFYPDLPKGYQITQYDRPIGVGGYLDLPIPAAPNRPASASFRTVSAYCTSRLESGE